MASRSWSLPALGLKAALQELRADPRYMANVTCWKELPPRSPSRAPFPAWLDRRIREMLESRGITCLYAHQAKAVEAVRAGVPATVVVTPTASGKTLCYTIPVLQALLEDPNGRALYIFPTKALAQDQTSNLISLTASFGFIKSYTYDGDTPQSLRGAIRRTGNIVVTNPDMLHTGILPHHTKWLKLFEGLKFVVIDEMHQYRGVFGSHVANLLARLRRVCSFYGSRPQFIACSATISNPKEFSSSLLGMETVVIEDQGGPSGRKHFVLYNPPLVKRTIGLRRSALLEATDLAVKLLEKGVSTIVFARSRVSTEVLLTYIKEAWARKRAGGSPLGVSGEIRGYRGGYLPSERRAIERGLREGKIKCVVSTNALELGIDIGHLEACIMVGYPGTIASTWQQAGRAGRQSEESLAVLVATPNPLDQYMVSHPDYFFERSPEMALIDPSNPYILGSHVKCAAFELPPHEGETFAGRDISAYLRDLEAAGILHRSSGKWYWCGQSYPADGVSLRSASSDNFVVMDVSSPTPRAIGEVDFFSAPMLIHEEAIYMHEGVKYQIRKLDYEGRRAYAEKVDVDYYTDANLAVEIKVLDTFATEDGMAYSRSTGEVLVRSLPTLYKKIRFHSHENLGWGQISLPETQMHTQGSWVTLKPDAAAGIGLMQLQYGLAGVANLARNVAPLFLMCDPGDIGVVAQTKSPHTNAPTVFFYDSYPGGTGLSEKTYHKMDEILQAALELVSSCPCDDGCPSCVGPVEEVGPASKRAAVVILRHALRSPV